MTPPPDAPPSTHRRVLFAAFFLSGISGLVYEAIWMRMLSFTFGSTTLALSTALAAFMGGLALGSVALGRWADRTPNPVRLYILLECLISLYGFSTLYTLPHLEQIYAPLLQGLQPDFYSLTALRFVLAFIVIGLGAMLMGGTLPLVSRILIRDRATLAQQFARLYAINTWGAVLGILLAGYVLIPVAGLRSGIALAALLNLAIALALYLVTRKQGAPAPVEGGECPTTSVSPPGEALARGAAGGGDHRPHASTILLLAFACSGFAALACQVLWTRSLTLIIGSSVYAFTIMLATFLFGIAAGSLVLERVYERIRSRPTFWLGMMQLALAFAVLLGAILIGYLPQIFIALVRWVPQNFFGIQFMEFFVVALILLPATLLMGAVFPLVCRIYSGEQLDDLGSRIGRIYAVNTVGAVSGALAAGFVLIPLLGTEHSLRLMGGLNLLIGLLFLLHTRPRPKPAVRIAAGSIVAALLLVLVAPAWNPIWMNSNAAYLLRSLVLRPEVVDLIGKGEVIDYDEDMTGSVMVYRMVDGSINLNLGGHNEGGTHAGDMNVQIEQALLPALLHPAPKKALLVGLGAGMTLGSLLQVPGIEQIDLVEISAGAIRANRHFAEYNHHALQDPRVNVIIDDARHYLAHTDGKYDLIINAPSYSWVSGTANIFTREFYQLAEARLAPGGLFAAWMHLYNITPPDIKRFARTLGAVFSDTSLWLSGTEMELILIGSQTPLAVNDALMRQRLQYPPLAAELARVSLPVPESLFGRYLMSSAQVADYAAGAEINTDNHPVMEFSIPRHLFQWDLFENLRSLVGSRSVATLPVGGMAERRGSAWVFPALGLQMTLPGWEYATDYLNTHLFHPNGVERRLVPRLSLRRQGVTLEVLQNGTGGAGELKAALIPVARGAAIQSFRFAGTEAYYTQLPGTAEQERFISFACGRTGYLGRMRGAVPGSVPWENLARGVSCVRPLAP